MDQYIGKLLDNRYEILEQIGVGGMARVYKARCHRLNRLVAVKILREDLAEDAELRRRFHDESQAVAMLSHPNIVAVYDVSRSSDLEYIVMELIDGITLKQYMQAKGNKLNWREALHFITQIVKALGHAHSRGIIHRDIKPHNIMVLRDGSVKVADFGIARVASGGHSTLTQEALGSVHYISPEQARGSHIDARSDLYSAGVVLYEMITGRLPFEGDTPVSVAIQHINSIPLSPRELDDTIPEALEAITMKAMAPNPDNRYSSADEMLADLEEFRKNPNINFDYVRQDFLADEPDDADKTQVVNTSVTRSAIRREAERQSARSHSAQQPRRRREEEREREEDSRGGGKSNIPIIAAVAAILLFVCVLIFMMFSSVLSSIFNPQSEAVTVPTVTGRLFSDVVNDQQLLNGFTLEMSEQREDDQPAGTIIQQDPAANASITGSNRTIKVVVSTGPEEELVMPDLSKKPLQEALNALNNLGDFEVDFTTRSDYHDTIEKDCVISTIPAAGSTIEEGDKIYLTMSLGKKNDTVPMIDLRGMTEEKALSVITDDLGLVAGPVQYSSSDEYPAGQVWFQSIAPKEMVEKGTTVNIIVSTGPSSGSDLSQSSKTIHFDFPDNGSVVTIEVRDGNGNVVYGPEEKDTNFESGVDFPVSGSGSVIYILYVDGREYSRQTVDFGA